MRFLRLLPVFLLAATPAVALTDEEIFRNFRFNFVNPGARSLGLGGAFVSIADDATAVQANPAGLGYFRRWEVFAEYRYVDNGAWSQTFAETSPGRFDTVVATGTTPEDLGNLSFLSYLVPVGRDRHLTLGFARYQVLDNQNKTINRFAVKLVEPPGVFLVEGSGAIDTSVVNYDFSIGYRFAADRVAIGGTLVYSILDVQSEIENRIVNTSRIIAGQPILEPTLDLRTVIDDSDSAYGVNLGLIWMPVDAFRLGAVYRRGPKFEVKETIDPQSVDGTSGIDSRGKRTIFQCDPQLPCVFDNSFSVPDTYVVSLGWQARDDLTVVQDFEYVKYSQLLDGYVPGVNILTDSTAQFTVDDALEYHLGTEYVHVFADRLPVAFRAGLFTQHDSTVHATSTGSAAFASPAAFPAQENQIHFTLGAGIVWSQGRFKIDAAADLSNTYNQFVFSFIIRGK